MLQYLSRCTSLLLTLDKMKDQNGKEKFQSRFRMRGLLNRSKCKSSSSNDDDRDFLSTSSTPQQKLFKPDLLVNGNMASYKQEAKSRMPGVFTCECRMQITNLCCLLLLAFTF